MEIFAERSDVLGKTHALIDLARCLQALGEYSRTEMVRRRAWHTATRLHAAQPRRDPLLADRPEANVSSQPTADDCGPLSGAERRVASLATQRDVKLSLDTSGRKHGDIRYTAGTCPRDPWSLAR